jgi:hypothetical protein
MPNPADLTLTVFGLTNVTPADGATGVPLDSNVTATFSGDPNVTSLSSSNFKLVKDGTSTPLPGTISYNSTTKVATLDPSSDLEFGTKYNATIVGGTSGVKSANDSTGASVALEQDKTWSFTTLPPPNTAPTKPGKPELDSGFNTPNQGVFDLTWAASTDDNKPDPPKAVTYRLEHKDANDMAYSLVSGAGSLITNSFSFPSTSKEGEGTWTYQVQASDSVLTSAFSDASNAIKVDRTAPSAPTATTNPTSPFFSDWFKDTVTVSYSGSEDGALPDDSAGSGVASYSGPETFSSSGTHSYSGTATDGAGNVSAPKTGSVKVDATAPNLTLTCPSSSAILGSTTANANWSATDGESGVAAPASGTIALDTSEITASKTATAPAGTAKDNVDHDSAVKTCNYSVAAGFNGFLQPIDGDMVNQGKTGRVYPIKWQLKNNSGTLISDALGLSLAQQMSVEQKGVPCVPDQVDSLETEVAAGSTTIRYDEASDQFIFNYKAPATKGCYDLNLKKADGVNTKTVKFTFTK